MTNNTPISNLIRIDRLPLLGRVLVPQQVADERPGAMGVVRSDR